VATGKEVRRFAGPRDGIKSVAFSPNGTTLAASSRDGRIVLWEAATGKEVLNILAHPGHKDAAFAGSPCLAYAPDGKTLASAGTDGTVRLWDPVTARELAAFEGGGACYALAFAGDGRTIVSGGADTTAIIWDLLHPVKKVPARPNVILFD
jgi:WD40 repeat protein